MINSHKITEEFMEYMRDESRMAGVAESISFPRNEYEVISIMKEMYMRNTAVTVQGARTGISAGAVPNGGHVMNLSKMDKVTAMRRNDTGVYHVTVQPGMILSKLRENIAKRKFEISSWDDASQRAYYELCKDEEQFFAPDPTEASATIGGMVACNASGARSFYYGPTRKHVTAIRVVLSNGETLHLKRGKQFARGRQITLVTEQGNNISLELPKYNMPKTKNTSGYFIEDDMDILDLFIGSDGTLGIITEIELQLLPMPKYIWGVSLFFKSNDAAITLVCDAREQVDSIVSIEYFDGNALDILRKQKKINPGFARLPEIMKGNEAAIYIELHCQGEEEALENIFLLQDLMEKCGGNGSDTWVARNDTDRDMLYFFRHAVPESVNMLIDGIRKTNKGLTKLGTDMSVPDDSLKKIMDIYFNMLDESGLQSATWGHIGDNHLHVNILPRNESEYQKGRALYRDWAEIVTKFQGAISAEHGVGKLKTDFLTIMYGKEYISEMADLKMKLDPKELLGNGNLFVPKKKVK